MTDECLPKILVRDKRLFTGDQKISAVINYRTSDGSVFEELEEAREHQGKLNFEEKRRKSEIELKKFINKNIVGKELEKITSYTSYRYNIKAEKMYEEVLRDLVHVFFRQEYPVWFNAAEGILKWALNINERYPGLLQEIVSLLDRRK